MAGIHDSDGLPRTRPMALPRSELRTIPGAATITGPESSSRSAMKISALIASSTCIQAVHCRPFPMRPPTPSRNGRASVGSPPPEPLITTPNRAVRARQPSLEAAAVASSHGMATPARKPAPGGLSSVRWLFSAVAVNGQAGRCNYRLWGLVESAQDLNESAGRVDSTVGNQALVALCPTLRHGHAGEVEHGIHVADGVRINRICVSRVPSDFFDGLRRGPDPGARVGRRCRRVRSVAGSVPGPGIRCRR